MLWIRGFFFAALAPGIVVGLVPYLLNGDRPLQGGAWQLGWIPLCLGVAVLLSCLWHFLAAGGTPAPFFTRRMRAIVGEEPAKLVCGGLYRVSRNPMFLGVLAAVFGQAVLYASVPVAIFGLATWLFLHLTVVYMEEPHLKRKQGQSYADYCRRVPRWLGFPR